MQNSKRSAQLNSGWKAFANDNGLKVGDVCVFELKRSVKAMLRVVIFRKTNNANSPSAQGKYEQMTRKGRANFAERPSSSSITRALKTYNETYPSFQIVMSSSYLRRNVNVPLSLAREFIFKNNACTVTLHVADRFWPVKLLEYRNYNKSSKGNWHKKSVFGKGWRTFVRQNALQVGNACEFKLINKNDGIVEVSISRKSEMEAKHENARSVDTSLCSSPSCSQEVEGKYEQVTRKDRASHGHRPSSTSISRALETNDEMNPSFQIIVSSTYLSKYVNVPLRFAQEFNFTSNACTVKLHVADRFWPVKLLECQNYKKSNTGDWHKKMIFSKGWPAFGKQNALQVGDACKFELINKIDGIVKVFISRESLMEAKHENASSVETSRRTSPSCSQEVEGKHEQVTHKDGSSNGQRPSSYSITRALETTDEEYPYFRAVMPAYLWRGILGVPVSFARKLIKHDSRIVKLQVADRFWLVKLIGYKNVRKSLFSKGWLEFVKENDLQVGNACEFQLINKNDGIIKVSISRVSSRVVEPEMDTEDGNTSSVDKSTCSSPCQSQEVEGTKLVSISAGKSGQAIRKDRALTKFREKGPSFRAVMLSAYLEHGSMSVPVTFAQKLIQDGSYMVKLQVADKFWAVKLHNHENKKCLFSDGWVAFARQNALRAGNVCEFELIDEKDGIIEVSIIEG